jgi:hypothetical protein
MYSFKKSSGTTRIATSVAIVGLVLLLALMGNIPGLTHYYSTAASSVVNAKAGGDTNCAGGSCQINFNFTNVYAGDVLVVAYFDNSVSSPVVSDTLGSSFTMQASQSTIEGPLNILTAPLSSTGRDNVTLSDTSAANIAAEVFEVSGVTTASVQAATGNGYCVPGGCDMSTSSSVAFVPGAFLVSILYCNCYLNSFTAGSGYTNETLVSPNAYGEYATSGVTSPTFFNATTDAGSGGNWYETALVLEPVFQTTTTTTSVTTTTMASEKISTHTHVTCAPNPDDAGKASSCTAKVTATGGYLPLGKVKFYSSKGGTWSAVICSQMMNSLVCTAKYTPPKSLVGMTTTVSAYYFAREHSDFRNSHEHTAVSVVG